MTAPAVMAGLMPRPWEMPRKAMPMEAAVPQEEPVAMEEMEQMTMTAARKKPGRMIFRP